MRLLVCGGRKYANRERLNRALDLVHSTRGIDIIIQGGADGADRMAAEWGLAHKIPVITYNADWKTHGPAAGPIRNRQMLAEGRPDGVVAFAGSSGTRDMVEQAEAAGLKVWFP